MAQDEQGTKEHYMARANDKSIEAQNELRRTEAQNEFTARY